MGEKYMLNRSEKFQFCIERPVPLCKHKAFCFQGWIEGEHLFKLETNWELTGHDHAGFKIYLEIFGYQINFELYDTRHWNHVEDRFYYYDEPELGWFSDKYRTEHYFDEIKKFIAAHPEIDKGYYRRCLLAYKIYMQNGHCMGWIFSRDMIEIGERTRQIYEELKLPHKKGIKKQGGWHTLTEYEKTDISAEFSEEKQIVSFLYDSHADDEYEEEEFNEDWFHDWELDETLRKELLKSGWMIILPSENLHKKDKDKQIRKIVSYLKNKAITINKSLRNKNFLTEIMRKKYEIKCFNLGHYFSGFYCDIQSRKIYDKNSLCIEIFNAEQKTLLKIAEELCDILNLPEILLKDYHTGEIMRFYII